MSVMAIIWLSTTVADIAPFRPIGASFWRRLAILYDTIAKVGATGDVTGNHLHICVIVDGVYVNPKGYLH